MKSPEKPPAPSGPDPAVPTSPDPDVSTTRAGVSTTRSPGASARTPVSTARGPASSSDPDPTVSTFRNPAASIDPSLESTLHITDVPSAERNEPPPAARISSPGPIVVHPATGAPAVTRPSGGPLVTRPGGAFVTRPTPSAAAVTAPAPTRLSPAGSSPAAVRLPSTGGSERPTAFDVTLAVTPPSGETIPVAGAPAPSLDEELPGERYLEAEALGAGGMGEVRVLSDRWIGRDVAKKSMRPELAASGAMLARFLREIRVQGQLEHPSIVPVYDVGRTESGELYFTMRRIQGVTLADVLDGLSRGDEQLAARFSRRKLLTAFSSVCMTVQYAHSRGVVHRDLKPQNIMLGQYGEVYVLDWGIAKILEGAQEVSEVGRAVGTLGYMAPEQARGKEVDARADVYALGVILFEILAGEHVLAGMDSEAVMEALTEGVDARPTKRARGGDVPPELEAVCVRATARLPADRFATAQAMSEAIEGYLDGDRDLTRRRELATGYAAEAESQADRALARGTPVAEAGSARASAVRNVLHALALAPEQPEATATLARLIIDVPDELPPGAEAERAAARQEERMEGARFAYRGFFAYAFSFPLIIAAGVRSWLMVGGGILLTFAAAFAAYSMYRFRAFGKLPFLTLLFLNMLIVMIHASWLGPFVLLPTSACITISLFALYAERPERRWVLAAGLATFVIPFALEILGLVPRGFSFEDGGLLLHPRALNLPPTLTTIAIAYSTIGYIVLPGFFLFRVRDALRVADDRRLLQAWTLKQLFPKGVRPG